MKPAGEVCPLCREVGAKWGERDGVPLRACGCGVLLAWPWNGRTEYEAQYAGLAYHEDACRALGLPPQRERFEEHRRAATARLDLLEAWEALDRGTRPRLLDVGASNGALVAEALERGYLAAGLEPSREMCRWVWQQHAIPLWCGGWSELSGTWQLITATDVIEHLTDPLGFLAHCRERSWRLYLETPDWHENLTPDWKHIKPREHPCLFSERALVRLAARTGWDVERLVRPIPGKLGVLFSRARANQSRPDPLR